MHGDLGDAIRGAGMAHPRKKILCIEDDRESAARIATALADRGFEIGVAHDGQDGLLAILKDKPDLVLCDVAVPRMSGFEVLERLNDIAPRLGRIPFVFLTASSDRKSELKGRQLGADDYITKPIDFDRLSLIIEARLAGVARNKVWPKQVHLNDREIEILTWVARGKTSQQIARRLRMSKRTVDFHIDNARVKLGAQTRAAAAIKAAIGGLIEP
jgi:DNA-binding NarL/FixJ family response regulator